MLNVIIIQNWPVPFLSKSKGCLVWRLTFVKYPPSQISFYHSLSRKLSYCITLTCLKIQENSYRKRIRLIALSLVELVIITKNCRPALPLLCRNHYYYVSPIASHRTRNRKASIETLLVGDLTWLYLAYCCVFSFCAKRQRCYCSMWKINEAM